MVAAVRPGELGLLARSHGPDDRRAEVLQPLAGDQTAPAGRRVEKNRFARLHGVRPANEILHRASLQHHRRRLLVADPVGNPHELLRRDQPALRVAAEVHAVDDAIADSHLGHAVADRLDDAGAFIADGQRERRRRVEPGSEVDVDVVEPDRRLPDQRLARSRIGDLDRLPAQNVRAAGFVNAHRVCHRSLPVCRRAGPVPAHRNSLRRRARTLRYH